MSCVPRLCPICRCTYADSTNATVQGHWVVAAWLNKHGAVNALWTTAKNPVEWVNNQVLAHLLMPLWAFSGTAHIGHSATEWFCGEAGRDVPP